MATVARRKNGTFRKNHSGNPSGVRKPKPEAAISLDSVPAVPQTVQQAQQVMNQTIVPGLTMRNFDAWATGLKMDSWVSGSTGIGDPNYDKRLSHRIEAPRITYQDAIKIYAVDDIAKRAIEGPIAECFRQGYELNITDEGKFEDLKTDVEDKINEIGLNAAIQKARFLERAFGGSAILLGVNDSRELDTPLNHATITSLDWLNVLEAIELTPVSYYQDPNAAKYGEVEFYELTTFTTFGTVNNVNDTQLPPPGVRKIHESRLIVFGGVKVSRYQVHTNVAGSLWGDSILTSLVDVLRDFNVAFSAAGLLAVDFGQPVISVENLMLLVAKNPGDFQARMRALETGRSTARAILIDAKKEKFERQGTTLTGFPDLLNALSMRLAAAVGMPMTLLLGMPTTGIGNDSSGDVRFYYDQVRGRQTTEIEPLLRFFIKIIMSTLRKRKLPKKWSIKFHELWQMTAAETAQAQLTQGRTDWGYIKHGVLYPDEVRQSRFRGGYSYDTQIDEKKKAPGFVTPPPAGTPGSAHNPGPDGKTTLGAAHTVGGYARRNPATSGTEQQGQGGENAVENVPGAAVSARKDAITELEFQISRLRTAQRSGDSPAVIALVQALVAMELEEQAHADGDGPATLRAFCGFPVMIETPAGGARHWTDTDGSTGTTILGFDYGYIDGALGSDGDSVDVYLGPNETAKWVYVIHQNKRPDFSEYDEDKVMLGFESADAARDAYLQQYTDERFFGGMSMLPVEAFRERVFAEAGKMTAAA